MSFNRDDRLVELISALAVNPTLEPPAWIPHEEWESVTQLAAVERELQNGAAAAPDLHDDPTAAMLGLIPDPAIQLDRAALKQLRKAANLTAGDLASQLSARGWVLSQREVFQWENQSAAAVSPALIEAIAAVLAVSAEKLTSTKATQASARAQTNSPRFQGLVARLSRALRIPPIQAASRLAAVSAVGVHRGRKPEEDQLLDTLEAYVRAMEAGQ